MTREQFRKEIIELENEFKTNDIKKPVWNEYQSLNRYFTKLTYPYGVMGIMFSSNYAGKFHCEVRVSTTSDNDIFFYESDNYYLISHGIDTHTITETQMDAIVSFLRNWIEKQKNENTALYERGKHEQPIIEFMSMCERVANETIKEFGCDKKYRAKLSFGKRDCDTTEYDCLCIEYYGNVFDKIGWHYDCGFTFNKDKYGINHITFMRPLMGETQISPDIENFKKYIISICK